MFCGCAVPLSSPLCPGLFLMGISDSCAFDPSQ